MRETAFYSNTIVVVVVARTEYTSILQGEAISLLRSHASHAKGTGSSSSSASSGSSDVNVLDAQDLIVAVDVAPYVIDLHALLAAAAPLLYAGSHEAGHPPGVLVLTVDLLGASCGEGTSKPLTETLRDLPCPDFEKVRAEYLVTRSGRMAASPCYLVAAAVRESLEVIEALRVDSAPVLGTVSTPSSSSSRSVEGDAGKGGGVATYIVVMQHQRNMR
jgi:hypothetical protein